METKEFDFVSKKFFDGGTCEEGTVIHIRMDNVLGIIPVLDEKLNPYENSHTKIASSYLKILKTIKEFLCYCIDTEHGVTLFFKHNDNKITVVKGYVKKVNKSNLVMSTHQVIVTKDEELKSNSLLSGIEKIFLNISPEKYLHKAVITFGEKVNMSPRDDMED